MCSRCLSMVVFSSVKASAPNISGAVSPDGLKLWKLPSSWMNHETFRRVLSELAKSLRHFLSDRLIVLLLDCARCHIHHSIVNLATRLGIWMIFVPSGLTWLLQPLDVAVFARVKFWLLRLCAEKRLHTHTDVLAPTQRWRRPSVRPWTSPLRHPWEYSGGWGSQTIKCIYPPELRQTSAHLAIRNGRRSCRRWMSLPCWWGQASLLRIWP